MKRLILVVALMASVAIMRASIPEDDNASIIIARSEEGSQHTFTSEFVESGIESQLCLAYGTNSLKGSLVSLDDIEQHELEILKKKKEPLQNQRALKKSLSPEEQEISELRKQYLFKPDCGQHKLRTILLRNLVEASMKKDAQILKRWKGSRAAATSHSSLSHDLLDKHFGQNKENLSELSHDLLDKYFAQIKENLSENLTV